MAGYSSINYQPGRPGATSAVGQLREQFGEGFNERLQTTRGQAQRAFTQAGDAAYQMGGSAGAARRNMLFAQGVTEGERAANEAIGRQQELDLQAQALRLQGSIADEQARQFGASFGLDQNRLAEQARQANLQSGDTRYGISTQADTARRSLAEQARQANMQNQQFGVAQQNQTMREILSGLSAQEYNPVEYYNIVQRLLGGEDLSEILGNSGGGGLSLPGSARDASGGSGGSGGGGNGGPSPSRGPASPMPTAPPVGGPPGPRPTGGPLPLPGAPVPPRWGDSREGQTSPDGEWVWYDGSWREVPPGPGTRAFGSQGGPRTQSQTAYAGRTL